jgi:hypothetical protein
MSRLIGLTQDQFAIVDDEDYGDLIRFKWYASWSPITQSFYAQRNMILSDGRKTTEQMSKRILGIGQGRSLQADHLNHNTIDNRRLNLRTVTQRSNHENRRDQSPHGAGVKFNPKCKSKPYSAQGRIRGKMCHFGCFATAEEARAARKLRIEGEIHE